RFERHLPLLGVDRRERGGGGVDDRREPHVVDDPRALQVGGDGDEAALAEVEDRARRVDEAVGAMREDGRGGARVGRVAGGGEGPRSQGRAPGGAHARAAGMTPRAPLWKAAMKIDGLVALVTGGASGLGEATVQTIVGAGGRAVILDRPQSAGADFAKSLG